MKSARRKARRGPLIPYARGFKPPTTKQRSKAVGSGLDPEGKKAFAEDEALFSPISQPTSIDDWLAQYNEEGQTYSKFLGECPWLSKRKVKYCKMSFRPDENTLPGKYPDGKIYILPLGEFDDASPDFGHLADYAARFFELPVKILPGVELRVDRAQEKVFWVEPQDLGHADGEGPKRRRGRRRSNRTLLHCLEARFHGVSGHYQLHGGSVLNRIKQNMPTDAICLMALTLSDLYDTPPDLFVAGLAAGNHRVGVFGLRRYNPALTFSTEHWHQITTTTTTTATADSRISSELVARTILQRSCKLLVHEIAHLVGVDHCIWYSCCMNGSGHLAEDFGQSMHLCPVDLRKLQHVCGFDVARRYQRLAEFFKKHGLSEEEIWVKCRLSSMQVAS